MQTVAGSQVRPVGPRQCGSYLFFGIFSHEVKILRGFLDQYLVVYFEKRRNVFCRRSAKFHCIDRTYCKRRICTSSTLVYRLNSSLSETYVQMLCWYFSITVGLCQALIGWFSPPFCSKAVNGIWTHKCDLFGLGEIKMNADLQVRCTACDLQGDAFLIAYDCGTTIPGNPHKLSEDKGLSRYLTPDVQGLFDATAAAVHDGKLIVSDSWWQRFYQNLQQRSV